MTRRRDADLAAAAREYIAQRSAAKITKATLLKERRALAALVNANGSIWVRQVGKLQVSRAFLEYGGRRRDLLNVLEDFFNWCHHMGYMDGSADPLRSIRAGSPRPRDNYYATSHGRCLACGWIGLVTPRRLEDPARQRVASTRLCAACASALTLSDVFG